MVSAGNGTITNHRLVGFDGGHVRFRWRDYADESRIKVMRLETGEFIRRFLLHVLPKGGGRIRHYGLIANRCQAARLARCRQLLAQPEPAPPEAESGPEMMLRLTGVDITCCSECGHGPLLRSPISKSPPRESEGSAMTMLAGQTIRTRYRRPPVLPRARITPISANGALAGVGITGTPAPAPARIIAAAALAAAKPVRPGPRDRRRRIQFP